MAKEIKRNNWSRFCKKFSHANRYRATIISINGRNEKQEMTVEPFMGITLTKKGRFIDGFQLFSGIPDPDKVVEPILTIKEPKTVLLEKDANGQDEHLSIKAKDGTEITLRLTHEPIEVKKKFFTERIAYNMFERRGFVNGNDMGDWFTAEQKIEEAAQQLTR